MKFDCKILDCEQNLKLKLLEGICWLDEHKAVENHYKQDFFVWVLNEEMKLWEFRDSIGNIAWRKK